MTERTSDGSEIQIELGDVKQKATEQRRRPDSDRALAVAEYGQAGGESAPVFVHERALRGIEAHAATNLSVELGGALLGGFYHHGGRQFVEIRDFITAKEVEHSSAQITFTHDTWAQIDAERESRAPGAQIVGWYHTHPDLGVFLSEPDTFIQRNFFKEPWQVAMVLDPVRGDRGFFQAGDGSLMRAAGFYVVAEKGRRKQVESYVKQLEVSTRRMRDPAPPTRRAESGSSAAMVWLALLTVAFLAVLAGEGLKGRPLFAPPGPGLTEQAAISSKMGDYEEAERLYARAVLNNPKDEAVLRDFARAREQADKQPDIRPTRQDRFMVWFLSGADAIARRGEYETAVKQYNAAGVIVVPRPGIENPRTMRDAETLAAYRYLAERKASSRGEGRSSADPPTVQKTQAGLKKLISAWPEQRKEMRKVLAALEKEYMLRPRKAGK